MAAALKSTHSYYARALLSKAGYASYSVTCLQMSEDIDLTSSLLALSVHLTMGTRL